MKTDKNSRTTTTEGTQPKPELTVPDSNQQGKPIRISYEHWRQQYRPIENAFDSNASFDGCLFRNCGEKLRLICGRHSRKIWTLVQCEKELRIFDGFHYVNRLGYFVTEVAAPENHTFSIKAD